MIILLKLFLLMGIILMATLILVIGACVIDSLLKPTDIKQRKLPWGME